MYFEYVKRRVGDSSFQLYLYKLGLGNYSEKTICFETNYPPFYNHSIKENNRYNMLEICK